MDDQPLIFVSYATPDRDRVFEYYDYLAREGFNIWMDKKKLKGGQNWDFEIKRALKAASIIVVFLSTNSVDRTGYAQREVRIALDQASDRVQGEIYIVPVMLDLGVPTPSELSAIQIVTPDESDPKEAVADAIRYQIEQRGIEVSRRQAETKLTWSFSSQKERWDGLPGYDSAFRLIRLSSEEYLHISEIGYVIQGWLLGQRAMQREVKYNQNPDYFNFGTDPFQRLNIWEATCDAPVIKERVISILYSIYYYAAGAARPGQSLKSFNYTLDPITPIKLEMVFSNPEAALKIIQDSVRSQLCDDQDKDEGFEIKPGFDELFIAEQTDNWGALEVFVFDAEGLDLMLPAHRIGPYGAGLLTARIAYDLIRPLMHDHYACALGIDYMSSGNGADSRNEGSATASPA